ncbi:MAG: hypothetical protein OXT09_12270 [Myxococcales bacterium]|nr:hypothetical protein [Myxococcales bacterium]
MAVGTARDLGLVRPGLPLVATPLLCASCSRSAERVSPTEQPADPAPAAPNREAESKPERAALDEGAKAVLRERAKGWLRLAEEEYRWLRENAKEVHPRVAWYIEMREGVSYTPIRDIASARAWLDLPVEQTFSELEADGVLRAHALQTVAWLQHERGDRQAALETVRKALSILEGRTSEKANALLSVVLGVYAKILGRDEARKTIEAAGLGWWKVDEEELLIAEARKAAQAGDWKQARSLLEELPPGTFQKREAGAALQADLGAAFMGIAAAPTSPREVPAKLFQWSCELGDLGAARTLLEEQQADARAWAYAHWAMATAFEHEGKPGRRAKLLERAWKLADTKPAQEWAGDLRARAGPCMGRGECVGARLRGQGTQGGGADVRVHRARGWGECATEPVTAEPSGAWESSTW